MNKQAGQQCLSTAGTIIYIRTLPIGTLKMLNAMYNCVGTNVMTGRWLGG
jgi:hypothetical protein